MQVDNIVTTNLHHGTCIALQNGKFHEGKKVPKCGLKSTIFHQLLETMQCRKLFKQSFGYKIFSGTGTTGDPSQATNAMQYVSRCWIQVTTLSGHFHIVWNRSDLFNFELAEEQDMVYWDRLQVPGATCLGGGHLLGWWPPAHTWLDLRLHINPFLGWESTELTWNWSDLLDF